MTEALETTAAGGVPRVSRRQAFTHRAGEIAAWVELLRSLDPGGWDRPTVCAGWDVADVVGHLCGQAEEMLKPWVYLARNRRARRRYPDVAPLLDAHNLVQADDRRGTPPATLIADFERLWTRASRLILRTPGPVRAIKVPCPGLPYRFFDRLALGYAGDVLLPRDLWTHRDDVSQALGRTFDPGAHGTEIVAQVLLDLEVAEVWTGPAVLLQLTGRAGGCWRLGSGEPVATVRTDAVALMRSISGRLDDLSVEPVAGEASMAGTVAAVRMPF